VWWTFAAGGLGIMFGTIFMALHATQGPHLGLPQMIQSRAQFGTRGVIFPFAATVFVYIGFMVFDVILGTQGLKLVLPGSTYFWYPVLVAVSIVIAVIGHDLLHFVQRWLTYLLIAVFGILTILAITNLDSPASGGTPLGWDLTAFLIQLSLAAGYNISYAVYVSDYTRYLPEDVPAPGLIAWVYAGAALSAVWLMSLGALLASRISEADAIGAIVQVGDSLFDGFGTFAVLLSTAALISIMGVNAYGAMLTGTSAVDGFRPVRPTVTLRVVGLTVVGIVTVLIALLIPEDYLDSFNDFVILMLYFLVPWTAVNLVDFYLVRHGRYAITEIFNPNGLYGRWAWRGVVAYLAGFVAMIPFFSTNFYVGPVAEALAGADVSFVVGLLVAGVLYLLFTRNLDMAAEAQARSRSLEELEGRGATGVR
jgi:nucleobase:cation symporter-1, NCS1 family